MENLNIVVIAGTTREERMTIHAARLVEEVGKDIEGIEIVFVDVADYFPLPGEGNDEESKDPKWIEINKNSDAYFIVAPEYNHGYPGSLKMLLDNDLGNYTHKPVAFAGVSSGIFGGSRMIEQLVGTVRELGMVASSEDVNFPKVQNIFDSEGKLNEKHLELKGYIKSAYNELTWLARALKSARSA